MRTDFETLTLERDGALALLTLRRPERLNSFNAAMHAELREAFAHLESESQARPPLRALLVTGAGRAFCAGQDLSERRREPGAPPPDLGASLRTNYNPLVLRIAQLPIPVVAAVNGVAAGAGASLAFACDVVIAARSASFRMSFSRVGLVPDAGATWIVPRLVGMARAKGLSLLGDALPAEQAQSWGLIWDVVDDDRLLAAARELALHLAAGATRAYALQKRAFAASWRNDLAAQLELEALLQAEAGRTQDFAEGAAAFLQKRTPAFRGD